MIRFDEVYNLVAEENEELPTIYCDMDMVLCNFLKGAEEVLGVPFPRADKREKWIKISSTKDFWANLEWIEVEETQRPFHPRIPNMLWPDLLP